MIGGGDWSKIELYLIVLELGQRKLLKVRNPSLLDLNSSRSFIWISEVSISTEKR